VQELRSSVKSGCRSGKSAPEFNPPSPQYVGIKSMKSSWALSPPAVGIRHRPALAAVCAIEDDYYSQNSCMADKVSVVLSEPRCVRILLHVAMGDMPSTVRQSEECDDAGGGDREHDRKERPAREWRLVNLHEVQLSVRV
jgi:hypothetical protein